MKVAFFGTPEFAKICLDRLIESNHEVVLVVSQPDRPSGRGRKETPPPVKVRALEANLPVFQPKSVKKPDAQEVIANCGADVAVVVAYGQILPGSLLETVPDGFLNIHGSLLPKYRGAAPIQWAIANGEIQTGVTIMKIDEGLDSGPMIRKAEIDILDDDDAQSIHDALALMGAGLMVEVLDELAKNGKIEMEDQDHDEATYAPLIKKSDAQIDWNQKAESIIWKVRGFSGWPGTFTQLDSKTWKIVGADAVDPDWTDVDWKHEDITSGTVVDVMKGRGLIVKAGENSLLLVTRVKPEGKKEMEADDVINGGLIKIGATFSSL